MKGLQEHSTRASLRCFVAIDETASQCEALIHRRCHYEVAKSSLATTVSNETESYGNISAMFRNGTCNEVTVTQ